MNWFGRESFGVTVEVDADESRTVYPVDWQPRESHEYEFDSWYGSAAKIAACVFFAVLMAAGTILTAMNYTPPGSYALAAVPFGAGIFFVYFLILQSRRPIKILITEDEIVARRFARTETYRAEDFASIHSRRNDRATRHTVLRGSSRKLRISTIAESKSDVHVQLQRWFANFCDYTPVELPMTIKCSIVRECVWAYMLSSIAVFPFIMLLVFYFKDNEHAPLASQVILVLFIALCWVLVRNAVRKFEFTKDGIGMWALRKKFYFPADSIHAIWIHESNAIAFQASASVNIVPAHLFPCPIVPVVKALRAAYGMD